MSPNISGVTGVLSEDDEEVSSEQLEIVHCNGNKQPHLPVKWHVIFKHFFSHAIGFYGFYLVFTSANWLTVLWLILNYSYAILGSMAGTHRLWSHRSYKAKWPLRMFLAYGQALNFHMDIIYWSRYHRIHHRYVETDVDPHNAKRGFAFCHMGWTYRQCTPEFLEKFKTVDVSDLHDDFVAKYQQKYYFILWMPLACYIVPTVVPIYFWNESFVNAFCVNIARYLLNLHAFFAVNSIAHLYGTRPYDRSIEAVETFPITLATFGEGWHNYHHVFPWDYKASEFGGSWINSSTGFINLMEKLGLAYDLKSVSPDLIERRKKKTGDGSC